MKYLSSVSLLLFLSVTSIHTLAQQDPILRSVGLRSFWYNPASFVTKNKITANATYGVQWANLAISPRNLSINAGFKLIQIKNKQSDEIGKVGLGLNYFNESVGDFNTQTFIVPMNLQFNLTKSWLSIGIAPGLIHQNVAGWNTPSPIPDPALPSVSATNFTMDLGVNWYSARFSLGAAIRHLAESRSTWYQRTPNYYLNGSYILDVSRFISINGVATFQTDSKFYTQCLMAYVNHAKVPVTLGIGMRDFANPVIGIYSRVRNFTIGYFMEYFNSALTNSSNLAHEFRIAFEIFDSSIMPKKFFYGYREF